MVAEVMRLMLFSQYRDGAPVLRADVSKLISSVSSARGLTSWIVAQAQVKFQRACGFGAVADQQSALVRALQQKLFKPIKSPPSSERHAAPRADAS